MATDDHSRLYYSAELLDKGGPITVGYLARAVGWYTARGVVVQRILCDNGGAWRTELFAVASLDRHAGEFFTPPTRYRTND